MDQYVKLAKNTIETYIRDRKIYRPAEDELTDVDTWAESPCPGHPQIP